MDTLMCKFGATCEKGKECNRSTLVCAPAYYGEYVEWVVQDPHEWKRGKMKCPLFSQSYKPRPAPGKEGK